MKPSTKNTDTGDIDPVCRRKIPEVTDELSTLYQGRIYRFCCPGCKREFDANPELYITGLKTGKVGGFWSRYLKRLDKSTGGKPQRCH